VLTVELELLVLLTQQDANNKNKKTQSRLEDNIKVDMRDTVSEYMNLTLPIQNAIYWGGVSFVDYEISYPITENLSLK
jgi:hypothetical protein